ncbi:CAP domain-containing protein [Streptomyces tagetis]|uniref:CAP domain-containing protein n=1 Tax=Streptomyces tagetis TaxID=2820809 RepID=A0A940XGE4_9ACTN|nr:CAP domain-containing protein [Streptomyces sp. RG38]MBQ0827959.1 CAP domain-containing protein [Streptomyces sp. RG38]
MGRHRRSDAGRAATGRAAGDQQPDGQDPGVLGRDADGRPAMGIAPYLNPEAYSDAHARSDAYLFAPDETEAAVPPQARRTVDFPSEGYVSEVYAPDDGPQRSGAHRRRKKKAATPVRTGLLGVSAAVALGTVAVATGAVPGLENYRIGGDTGGGDRVQAEDAPTNSPAGLGGTSGSAEAGHGAEASTSRGTGRTASPSAPASSTAPASPSASPSAPAAPVPEAPAETAEREAAPETTSPSTPSRTETKAPERVEAPVTVSEQAAAEAAVLKLVNEERAKVGCSPLAASSALRDLAENFSKAMAAQGFFDHTDPSGATPWDRAEKAGIANLGGENIARGQADAQAVMDAWMNSPGHRANILNCDFRTLGVGVHFANGGPWWTQNFGY